MNDEKFTYDYTAPTKDERREIEDIKRRYGGGTKRQGKMERLRYLDSKVKTMPTVLGLSLGIVGTLLFGLGLTMVLEWGVMVGGIALMAVACLPIAAAYPVYGVVYARNKSKYGDEILRLSDELLNGDDN